MSCRLARIEIFPIKSLDGVAVTEAVVLDSGALRGDRTYALFDDRGQVINAKRTAAIQRLRSHLSEDGQSITLAIDGQTPATFHLEEQQPALEDWFSEYFQQPVTLRGNYEAGFPDDTAAAGPTVISTASLQAVADWYGLFLEDVRRRFRANLEIDGVPPFWEDQLFSADSSPIRFAIGEVVLEGINPCQRCIVPTRNPLSGAATPAFQKTFSDQRAATLPTWAPLPRFNHFYKLAVNTNIPQQGGKTLRVGDAIRLGASLGA